jgi:hypothetical protein
MKKVAILFTIVLCIPQLMHAQEPAINLGDKFVNLGLGLGSVRYTGTGYRGTIPPLSISYESIIRDEILEKGYIGIGAYLGFSSYKWTYSFWGEDWGYRYTNIIPGARGSFHYPVIEKLDTYTGVMLGYEIISSRTIGTIDPGYNYRANASGFVWSWYAGGRYFISDRFILMGEIGYGITYLNIGIALNL